MKNELLSPNAAIRVGTVVRALLSAGVREDGAVVRVYAKPGALKEYDILFDDGTLLERVQEALVRCPLWAVFSAVETAEQLGARLTAHRRRQEAARRAEQDEKAEFDRARQALLDNPEFSHLDPQDDGGPARVAKNIRAHLKKKFPGVRFSVITLRGSMTSAVAIGYTDGPLLESVEKEAHEFRKGDFDSTDDSYRFRKSPFVSVFGGVRFVSVERDFSPEAVSEALDLAWASCAWPGEKPSGESALRDRRRPAAGGGLDLSDFVRMRLATMTVANGRRRWPDAISPN